MNMILALVVSAVFVVLSAWHVHMAVRPDRGVDGGVPVVSGKPLFVPSARATIAVALVLLVCAVLVAAAGGWLQIGVAPRLLYWGCLALAGGLFARAVGDFRYVGFFKRVRGSRFARLDTSLYSPLCLLLAIGVAFVAFRTAP